MSQDWTQLFADVAAPLQEDPAGAKAQALAVRWKNLLSRFTGGNAEVQQGLNRLWADKENRPGAGVGDQAGNSGFHRESDACRQIGELRRDERPSLTNTNGIVGPR